MKTSPAIWNRSWTKRMLICVVALMGSCLGLVVTSPQAAHASCAGDAAFIVTATTANTSGYITTIDNWTLNGIPAASPLVTQLWPNQYDPHPLGVWYNSLIGRWTVFNEDSAAIPLGTSFVVADGCHGLSGRTLTQITASSSNIQGDAVFINDVVTNGNPNAVVYATQAWTGTYNTHEIGVYYNTVAGKWAIYNLDGSAMPVGASFDIWAGQTAAWPNTLSVSASSGNIVGGYMVYLNDARFNGQPGLAPIVSQVYYMGPCNQYGCPGVINNHPVGVWYDTGARQWVIYNVDLANMPTGASFFISADM